MGRRNNKDKAAKTTPPVEVEEKQVDASESNAEVDQKLDENVDENDTLSELLDSSETEEDTDQSEEASEGKDEKAPPVPPKEKEQVPTKPEEPKEVDPTAELREKYSIPKFLDAQAFIESNSIIPVNIDVVGAARSKIYQQLTRALVLSKNKKENLKDIYKMINANKKAYTGRNAFYGFNKLVGLSEEQYNDFPHVWRILIDTAPAVSRGDLIKSFKGKAGLIEDRFETPSGKALAQLIINQ